jgi:hypothetical protein
MKEIISKSYSEKKASLGESMSRGFDMFSRMTNHPLWRSFWRGTHLDAKSGMLGQGLKALEIYGVTDREGRELASATRDMVSLIDATEPECFKIPDSLKDVLEKMNSNTSSIIKDYKNKSKRWRNWCNENFDFGPFSSAYNRYIKKHTNEIGKIENKAIEFSDLQMSLLFESVYKLLKRIQNTRNSNPQLGEGLCI